MNNPVTIDKLADELANFGSLMTRGQLTQPRSVGPRIVGIAEEIRALAARQDGGEAGDNELIEQCAIVAEAHVDPEWPGDDLSSQARAIANDIRNLKRRDEQRSQLTDGDR